MPCGGPARQRLGYRRRHTGRTAAHRQNGGGDAALPPRPDRRGLCAATLMRFVLRRLGFFALTLWVALTLNFLLPRLMPGNPALAVIGQYKGGVSPQALKALEAEFGLNTHQ